VLIDSPYHDKGGEQMDDSKKAQAKVQANLSYRVAMARNCLSLPTNRSTQFCRR
jgi:hypothetical protein